MRALLLILILLACFAPTPSVARDQIAIVGSSTVFPFATSVAENFGRRSGFKTPVVEATGSGGGIKLFCAGVGLAHPDIVNASRRMKASEFKQCAANGVAVSELVLGYDGIVLATAKSAPPLSLTLRQIYLAVAKYVPTQECADWCEPILNPHKKWSDIDARLPAIPIEILGPPATSGTRDAFQELALENGAKTYPHIKNYKKTDKQRYKALVHTVREDGAWIDAGENDNLMVSKLVANPRAVGVFGFSFLDQNRDKIRGARVDNAPPQFEAIAEGRYNISRSLYVYVKHAHIGLVGGINEFIAALASEAAIGDDGYLLDKGLIPQPRAERERYRRAMRELVPLTLEQLNK